MKCNIRWVMICAMALALPVTPCAADKIEIGRRIFDEGRVADNIAVTGRVGGQAVLMEGSVVACANCHGADAAGSPQKWGRPPAIGWTVLSDPLGAVRVDGSVRRPYNHKLFSRAVQHGIDSDGRPLDATMPRFSLREAEIASLAAYLKSLDRAEFAESKDIVVATFALAGTLEQSSEAQLALRQCVDSQPLLFGRKVRLQVYDPKAFKSVDALIDSIDSSPSIVAVVAPVIASRESEAFKAFTRTKIPIIGPLTFLTPQIDSELDNTFFLFGGLREEVIALTNYSTENILSGKRMWIVHGNDDVSQSLARLSVQSARAIKASTLVEMLPNTEPIMFEKTLRKVRSGDVIIWLTAQRIPDELLKVDSITISLPSIFITKDIPIKSSALTRIIGSYPWIAAYRGNQPIQSLWTRLSCDLAFRGIGSASGNLSRADLIKQLESLTLGKQSELPPLRFGVGKRIGALGAFVLPISRNVRPELTSGSWVELDSFRRSP